MRLKTVLYFLIFALGVQAQEFESHFKDKTLRLDYIFGGNREKQFILLDELAEYPHWYGRQKHLDQALLRGDGQVRVYDGETQELLYVHSFSTLFQEWLSTEEAQHKSRSFENVFLVPFPKKTVEVKVVLFDSNGKERTELTHVVDPKDVLIRQKRGERSDIEYIHKAAPGVQAIDVVLVAEGYKAEEMDRFVAAAKEAVAQIVAHAPFDTYKEHFNFVAVKSVSEDSGVSVPRKKKWKNTAVESNFDTFYSDRYLTTNRLKKLHDILAGIPYEHIIILANTDVYGGGGIYNAYTLTTTGHKDFKPVVVHEFGHSFAGLADEYFYEDDVLSEFISSDTEPWEQNITTLVDFEGKWQSRIAPSTPIPTPKEWLEKQAVGVYEGLPGKRIYKATGDCRMKANQSESFCVVCRDAIERLILFTID